MVVAEEKMVVAEEKNPDAEVGVADAHVADHELPRFFELFTDFLCSSAEDVFTVQTVDENMFAMKNDRRSSSATVSMFATMCNYMSSFAMKNDRRSSSATMSMYVQLCLRS